MFLHMNSGGSWTLVHGNLANKPLIYQLEIIYHIILWFQWKWYLTAISKFWLFIIYERYTFPLNNLHITYCKQSDM